MAEAKYKLEQVSGNPVVGFRAPNAFISGWMIDSLERCGFAYDSSVCVHSLFSKMDAKPRNIVTKPYYPQKGTLEVGERKRSILEIPWPHWSIGELRLPTAGGPFLRFFGARYIAAGLEQCLMNGDTVFYFHSIDVSGEKFPDGFSKHRPFYWAMKGKVVEKRVEWVLKRFRDKLGTCRDILSKVRSQS